MKGLFKLFNAAIVVQLTLNFWLILNKVSPLFTVYSMVFGETSDFWLSLTSVAPKTCSAVCCCSFELLKKTKRKALTASPAAKIRQITAPYLKMTLELPRPMPSFKFCESSIFLCRIDINFCGKMTAWFCLNFSAQGLLYLYFITLFFTLQLGITAQHHFCIKTAILFKNPII